MLSNEKGLLYVEKFTLRCIRRQLNWPIVLPHLIFTLYRKALPHLKDNR